MKTQECEQIYREELAKARAFGEAEMKRFPLFSLAFHTDPDGTVAEAVLYIDYGRSTRVHSTIYSPNGSAFACEWRALVKEWAQRVRHVRAIAAPDTVREPTS